MVRMSMARLGSDNHTLPHHLHGGLRQLRIFALAGGSDALRWVGADLG